MKLKPYCNAFFRKKEVQKLYLIMRLTVLFMIVGMMQVMASGYSQVTKFKITERNMQLEKLFEQIEKNSAYKFFYNNDDIDASVEIDINAEDQNVFEVLDQAFETLPYTYKVLDNQLIFVHGQKQPVVEEATIGQQTIQVKGKVTDTQGEPLPGVSIVEKGTTNGTITGVDGSYTIDISSPEEVLVFSFIGFELQDVNVAGRSTIDITLVEEVTDLSEVVVVGYGVQKKVSLTNSVAQVTGDDLAKRPVANTAQSLQGMASGVVVVDNGGRPGASDVNIRVRGLTTLGDNNPLIIVDGIEQRMSDINPDDIQSISILKDASSTAIYGSRAANGVVLITTRRAKEGDVQISYHGYYGIQKAINRPEHLGLRDYMELENVARVNAGRAPLYTEEYINEYVNATDREKYPLPFPWFDKGVMLKNAPQQNHTLSLSGGNDFVKARASLRHQDIDGIVSNFSDKTSEIRVNTDFKLSEKINVSFDVNYRTSEDTQPYAGVYNVFNYMLHATKFSVPQYSTGEYGLGPQNNNPLLNAEMTGLRTNQNDYFFGKLKADYQIVKDLRYTFEYAARNSATQRQAYKDKYRNEDPVTGRVRQVTMNSLEEYRSSFKEFTMTHLLNYTKQITENHSVNALIGYSTIDNDQNWVSAYRQDFYNNDIQSLRSGAEENKDNDGVNSFSGLKSYFGRVNYNFADKYLLEANARYDGSSRFSEKKQYAFFPSFSGAWRISREGFWSQFSGIVNEFKLRGSWGLTGNQAIPLFEFFPALSTVDYAFNENAVQGYAQKQFVNEDLTWEVTRQWDLGFDMGFLDNRINWTFDYYNKRTEDILLELPIPATVGLEPSYQNAGVVSNKGWETGLTVRGGKQLKYNIGVNVSRNKNVVEDLYGTGPYITGGGANQTFIIKEGLSMNSLWGYHTDGFFQSQEEIDNYPTYQSNTKPGDTKYLNLNGDDKINPDDRDFLGHTFPIYSYSSTMNFSYKNFELFMQWQGASGHTTQVAGGLAHQATYEAFTHKIHKDYWTEDNRDARWPRPIKSNLRNLQASDLLTVDADYLRLKNIMLSYNVPNTLLNKLPISKAQVYVNATNLLTFSKLNEWNLDPEMPAGRANYYPQVSLYTVGLKLNF